MIPKLHLPELIGGVLNIECIGTVIITPALFKIEKQYKYSLYFFKLKSQFYIQNTRIEK